MNLNIFRDHFFDVLLAIVFVATLIGFVIISATNDKVEIRTKNIDIVIEDAGEIR